MILKDKCMIQRYVKGEKSPTGAVKTSLTTIAEHWPCYIEDDDGVIVVPQEGQTAISYHTMFVGLDTDITTNDVVIDEATGQKFKVLDCNYYRILPHIEVKMQYGTVI